METTIEISLYSYLYLKLTKLPCFSHYLLCFFFYKIREQEGGWNMFCVWVGGKEFEEMLTRGGWQGKLEKYEYGANNLYRCM
jgi:hypothetical protein